MKRLLVLALLPLAACSTAPNDPNDSGSWGVLVDPVTGVTVRCYDDGGHHGQVLACYVPTDEQLENIRTQGGDSLD